MMGMDRLGCCLGLVTFGWIAIGNAQAIDDSLTPPIAIETAADEPLPEVSNLVSRAVAGQTVTCEEIGGWDDVRPSRVPDNYRGNVYQMVNTADLLVAKAQLDIDFGVEVELFFSFHREVSAAESPVFVRVAPDVVLTVIGEGNPVLYSTELLPNPITLEAGYDYLIGVSWHSTAVWYGRDVRNYPRPFLHGTVRGLVATETEPPLPGEVEPFLIWDVGAYEQELCFEPVAGACCKSVANVCQQELEVNCDAPGSFFHGERVGCSEVLCQFGACCFPCGGLENCSPDYTPETCESEIEGGIWSGSGIACSADLCPRIEGACCWGATCTETCRDECDGEYLDHYSTCRPNLCAGACCVSGFGCDDLTPELCVQAADPTAYRGDGTTCAELPSDPNVDECGGACCASVAGNPICINVDERRQCSEDFGLTDPLYLGDGLICQVEEQVCADTDPASPGACCLPDGTCLRTSSDFCDLADGQHHPLAYCTEVTCGTFCCNLDTDVCMVSDAACEDGWRELTNVDSCLPNPCSLEIGVCCQADGTCQGDVFEDDCPTSTGHFVAGAADCSSCPADLGACCVPNGTCADRVTEVDCAALGADPLDGDYHPELDCADEGVDCPRLGACCSRTGECFPILQEQCDEIGGGFVGEGVACGNSTCPLGACCIESECTEVTAHQCTVDVGDYRGDDSSCNDSSIACGNVAGACCLSGECEGLLPQECVDEGGVFEGVDAECGSGLCGIGACCDLDGECEDEVVASQCTDEFLPGLFCFNSCEPRGACCSGETCIDRLSQQECEDGLLGSYSGAGTVCDDDLCVLGACCLGDDICDETMTRQECEENAGVYQGEGASCGSGICVFGVCCHLDGSCDDFLVVSQCQESFDQFNAGFECSALGCPAAGACCVEDDCVDGLSQDECGDIPYLGTYDGDGSLCVDEPCVQGACCLPGDDGEGVCDDVGQTRQRCETAGGLFLGIGSGCTGIDCTPGRCCTTDGACSSGQVVSTCDVAEDFRAGYTCSNLACVGRGACCLPDNPDEPCQILGRQMCVSEGGTYDGNSTTCDPDDLCTVNACCLPDQTCAPKTRQRCERARGIYMEAGTTCEESPCQLAIIASSPMNCAIDPGQPTDPAGSSPAAWDVIELTFNRAIFAIGAGDFEIEVVPGPAVLPEISGITLDGATVTLELDPPIPPGHWSCFLHTDSGAQLCFGYLPADVNGDGNSTGDDVSALIDHLNQVDPPLAEYQCDVDRSGRCTPADVLRAIDLLNGGDSYDLWMERSLPACPSMTPARNVAPQTPRPTITDRLQTKRER